MKYRLQIRNILRSRTWSRALVPSGATPVRICGCDAAWIRFASALIASAPASPHRIRRRASRPPPSISSALLQRLRLRRRLPISSPTESPLTRTPAAPMITRGRWRRRRHLRRRQLQWFLTRWRRPRLWHRCHWRPTTLMKPTWHIRPVMQATGAKLDAILKISPIRSPCLALTSHRFVNHSNCSFAQLANQINWFAISKYICLKGSAVH